MADKSGNRQFRWTISGAAIAVLVVSAPATMAAQTPEREREPYKLTVSRYTGTNITEREVDDILVEMGRALQTDDSNQTGPDIACGVEFVREGEVLVFFDTNRENSYLGDIDSQADLDEIEQIDTDVKVVDAISYCNDDRNNFLGCSLGTSFIAVNLPSSADAAIIWAHEFGHVRGLPDRSEAGMIMSGTAARALRKNRRVDPNECREFGGEP